jgi:hypothetical protein
MLLEGRRKKSHAEVLPYENAVGLEEITRLVYGC